MLMFHSFNQYILRGFIMQRTVLKSKHKNGRSAFSQHFAASDNVIMKMRGVI